ncbi:MAG TPA: peptide ABC transporter substrate-binding protein [Candidatus Dormibacteraeota bacterium]|nr:peptide ABC transporter substrate-binding protein [Candidatus Dormibacteraeota bacterium]
MLALRRTALLAATALVVVACQPAGPPPKELATTQILRLAIASDISSLAPLDPPQIGPGFTYAIGTNIFGGLYRFNDHLRLVPDIASGSPDVSTDGRTYTFHLRQNVTFSNGDPVTSADFVYSWNRAAPAQNYSNFTFGAIDGYHAIVDAASAKQPIPPLTGLSAPDARTLVVHLTAPTSDFLATLALPGAWVVDAKAIAAGGQATWWTNPDGLVGTGPFRLTARTRNESLVFTPVPHWWGGSTGELTRVELQVLPPGASQWQAYQTGKVDVLGFAAPVSAAGLPELTSSLGPQLRNLASDPVHRAEIHTWPFGHTDWVGFNFQAGPFSGAQGRDLRQAFSQAIDRSALAQAVCENGWICTPANGGLITKGLQGYLGDRADTTARFDPATARATIERLDPGGSRLRGLVYTYGPPSPFLESVASNLHDQWKANLGLDIPVHALDPATFFSVALPREQLTLFRGTWVADYDHPKDWFDNLFTTSADQVGNDSTGSGYSNLTVDSVVAAADRLPLDGALAGYQRAGRLLLDDQAMAALFYWSRTELVKPYVDGYGANLLLDYSWTPVRILSH